MAKEHPPAAPDAGIPEDDLDYAEAEAGIKDNLKRNLKDRDTRRLGFVVLGALAVTGAAIYYRVHVTQEQDAGAQPAARIERPVSVPQDNEAMSPAKNPMAERLAQGYEEVLARQALESGKSYVAPPPVWQEQQDPLAPASAAQVNRRIQDQREQGSHNDRRAEFVKALLEEWKSAPPLKVVRFPVSEEEPPIRESDLEGVGEATLHLPAGTRFYASISGNVDSYVPGPVRAVIEEGPLAGAVLLGSLKALPTERIVLTFERLAVGEKSYSVNAIALDAIDQLPAVSGDVDRHYLRRYVLPFALNLMAGFGQTLAYGTDIAVTGSGVVVGNNDISDTQRWIYAAGQAGLAMLPALAAGDAAKYAQVKLHDGQGIGVMLLEDL